MTMNRNTVRVFWTVLVDLKSEKKINPLMVHLLFVWHTNLESPSFFVRV